MKLMNTKIMSLLLCASAITASSCSGNNEEIIPGSSSLKIKTAISSTRAVIETENFSYEDEIGIFALNEEGTAYSKESMNMTGIYVGDNQWNIDPELFLTEQKAVIYAYYPYSSSNQAPATVNVNIMPNYHKTIKGQIDYLYGQGEADAAYPEANITFNHALARVTFLIKKEETDAGKGILSKIILRNTSNNTVIATSGTMDIRTGEITPKTNEDAAITLTGDYELNSNKEEKIDFLVIPAQISDNTVELALTVDDGIYIITLPATVWEKGQQYTYPVTISRKQSHT